MHHPRHAAITGLGAVSPLGVGMGAYVRGLREGRSGVRRLTFSDSRIRSTAAAFCPEFDPLLVLEPAELARVPRLVPMALAAAREAVRQSGWTSNDLDAGDDAPGLILGTGGGGVDFTLDQAAAGHGGRRPSLWSITNATHGNLAGELSISLGVRGPSLCVSTGCASASDAVGLALELLRSDRPGAPRAMVVVGADAPLRWESLYGMELLRVISTRECDDDAAAAGASRPFDLTRDGFILGEGAWAIVLERPRCAQRSGRRVIARLRGYGCTCDAYHRVRPDPEMTQSVAAMRLAVRDAGLEPDHVDVVHYHGTATQLNDALETLAVRAAFGEHSRRLVGHSVKGAIGHPQGACGLAAVCATVGALAGLDGDPSFLPPTINLREPDPACDLDYTPNAARASEGRRTALINCLAFGAKNSALVVDVPP